MAGELPSTMIRADVNRKTMSNHGEWIRQSKMFHGSPLIVEMAKERQVELQARQSMEQEGIGSLRRRTGQLLIAAGLKLQGQQVAPIPRGPAATPASKMWTAT